MPLKRGAPTAFSADAVAAAAGDGGDAHRMRMDLDSDGSDDAAPGGRSTAALERFLLRHRALTDPFAGRWLPLNAYGTGRCLAYDADRERGLFVFVNLHTGESVCTWDRCHYTLSARVEFRRTHRPHCDRRPLEPSCVPTVTGALLHQCACPVTTFNRRGLWLVYPRDLTVRHTDGRLITHGLEEGDWERSACADDPLALDEVRRRCRPVDRREDL